MTHTDDDLLTPRDLAAYLDRTVAALAQLRFRGTGPTYTTAGGRVRYRWVDVRAWLDGGARTQTGRES